MAGLPLKEYQRESLKAIEQFCDAVRSALSTNTLRPVHAAYIEQTGRNFVDVPQLPDIPYVCLRVPTGGGKTLIAAHAVGTIAKHLGHQDRPLCLWVTPSTTIRDQTFNRLRDPDDPYHAALRDGLGGVAEVMLMEDALSLNRSLLTSSAVVVVTTIQSYRIDNEANRKVYEDSGYLMEHFTALPGWLRDLLAEPEDGQVRLSLANVMKLRGPIVIMDEAHNARTRISFDSLARFGPLSVLELTATPQQEHDPEHDEYASNVLHAVSALQLKREGMIKLPIELESRDNWLDVLAAAKQQRDALEHTAREWGQRTGRFIRPIALIQAESRRQDRATHTVDAIKEALTQMGVPVDRVRIVTGDRDELGDENLHRKDCVVEYVVTVEKLREGWDCHFAYVLGSVGNVATETAVEQLLGRIMRMPDAIPTEIEELDRAYAIIQSQDVVETATNLCDSLVRRCGFDAESVNDALRVHRSGTAQGLLPVSTIHVSVPVAATTLPETVRQKVRYDAGSGTLHVQEPLTRAETIALRDSLPAEDRPAIEQYWETERAVGTIPKNLDQYAQPIRVPQLIVRDGDRCRLFEPEELDEFSWSMDRCNPKLSENDFSVELNAGERVILGVADSGGIRIGGVQEVILRQLSFVAEGDDWSKQELSRWLDGELHRGGALAGLTKAESQAWLVRVLDFLLAERHADLRVLVRKRYELADVVIRKIAEHGRKQVRRAAEVLIDNRSPRRLETSMDAARVLEEPDYGPYRRYNGPFTFPKHAFDLVGEMNDDEADCARRINDDPNVKRWVRNLDHESAGGYSLPLSPGRFFPDFIAELEDGRTAIIEYKNSTLDQVPSEQYKKTVGELWESRSDGTCVFVWVVERNWHTLDAKLAPIPR